jgi:hypothetical protein
MQSGKSILQLACAALVLVAFAGSAAADDDLDAIAKDAISKALDTGKAAKETPASNTSTEPSEPLAPLADNKIPAPLPATAEEIEYDAAEGSLDFTSASTVKQLAEFYRAAMKPLGWTEHRSPINKDNMVVLDFVKGEDNLNFTIMRMGDQSKVSASAPALVSQAAEAAAPEGAAAADPELTVEDSGGLPIPAPHSQSGNERSLFRYSADASTPASIDAIVAFYRRELGKRNWKELPDKAVIKKDSAQLAFNAPDGPAQLKLGRENNETTIALSVRDQAKAAKSPLLPKAGQVKIMFGNMGDKAAEVMIGGKTLKVPVGAGAKGPDGPIVELAPGKYEVALKSAAQRENVETGPDEIWMVMIGPGGMLAVQAY